MSKNTWIVMLVVLLGSAGLFSTQVQAAEAPATQQQTAEATPEIVPEAAKVVLEKNREQVERAEKKQRDMHKRVQERKRHPAVPTDNEIGK